MKQNFRLNRLKNNCIFYADVSASYHLLINNPTRISINFYQTVLTRLGQNGLHNGNYKDRNCQIAIKKLIKFTKSMKIYKLKDNNLKIGLSQLKKQLDSSIDLTCYYIYIIILYLIETIMVLCRLPKMYKHLMRTMTTQLVEHESIMTTKAKAKYLRKHAGKVLKLAKKAQKGQKSALNLLRGRVDTKKAEQKLLLDLMPRIKKYHGPLIFISPVAFHRKGDNAQIVRISIKGNSFTQYQKRRKQQQIEKGNANLLQFSKRTLLQQKQYYQQKLQENPQQQQFFKKLIQKVELEQWINNKDKKQPPRYTYVL